VPLALQKTLPSAGNQPQRVGTRQPRTRPRHRDVGGSADGSGRVAAPRGCSTRAYAGPQRFYTTVPNIFVVRNIPEMASNTQTPTNDDPRQTEIPVQLTTSQPEQRRQNQRPNRRVRRRQLRRLLRSLTLDVDPSLPPQPPSPKTADQPNPIQYCCTIAALNSQLPELAAVQCDCNDPV
jgi:hypothetical protein